MPGRPAEQIWRGLLRGPLFSRIGNTNPWAFRTSITTAAAVASVTTVVVNSDSLILFGLEQTSVNSQNLPLLVVKSINPGVSFTFGWANNTAQAINCTVMGIIVRTS